MSGMKKPWEGYVIPFRIWGNLYYVGTEPASTHIIDTGEGLIMLDTGYQQSLYLVIHNMHELGLRPKDLKYIFLTHGHIDHLGAARALKELTGAKIFLGEQDKLYATGELNLTYAKELGMEYSEVFVPDVLLHDGDVIELGNTKIECIATPGHTPGTFSFFFDVYNGNRVAKVGLHGGMGINTLTDEYLKKYNLPFSLRDDFVQSMNKIKDRHVDIFLGNHMQHNRTLDKYEELLLGNEDAFVDISEWKRYMEWCICNLENVYR